MKIGEMLNLLDGYPCELRCRYANKVACFTKVFLISNISLNEQYTDIQRSQSETWNAFLRRIHHVQVFTKDRVHEGTCSEYISGFVPALDNEIPFTRPD